ncbi:beta-lactamase family protein, partial [candidate division KSB1 bacterium]|nr:beta-lactamase family protein [candidate division KSB1 bacterium]
MKKIFCYFLILALLISSSWSQESSIANESEVVSAIQLAETWITAQMEYFDLPGLSVGIVYDQDLIWSSNYGYSNVEMKIPMTPQTIFRIASITKLFTCTAIMQLRDQGKLQLDDPVEKYLPWFKIRNQYPDSPPIAIRHLMTHTSGLPREAAFPYWTDHKFPTLEQIIDALRDQETIYPSETKWKYSNLGMALLGEIVAAASGEAYENYIQNHIVAPLQMTSTSVNLTSDHKKRLAVGYGRRLADGTRKIMPFTDSKGLTPAANISSTVEDLAKFAALQFRDGNV